MPGSKMTVGHVTSSDNSVDSNSRQRTELYIWLVMAILELLTLTRSLQMCCDAQGDRLLSKSSTAGLATEDRRCQGLERNETSSKKAIVFGVLAVTAVVSYRVAEVVRSGSFSLPLSNRILQPLVSFSSGIQLVYHESQVSF